MSLITIVLPVYNGESYLREAIDSVLAQTFRDFELWVVNDGSTDGSMAIVDSYSDQRVVRMDNPRNLGVVATQNQTFAKVTSPYIARMDQDDIWHPQKLELQVRLLESRPDVGVCGTSIHKFGDIDSIDIFPEESDALKVGLLFYCMMSHPSVIFRRSMLEKTGLKYNAEFAVADDYKLWIDILQYSNIYNLQQPLVEYRQHAGQTCRKRTREQEVIARRLREEQLRLVYPHPSPKELNFHLDRFVSLRIESDGDVLSFINWSKRLCEANENSHYIQPRVLREELSRYVQNAIRTYYIAHPKSMIGHLVSGRWRNLDLRHNLSLLKNARQSQDT